jgi:Sulfotransferase family
MTEPNPPILIVGLPRSGTTWTMRALTSGPGTTPIGEPDNEDKVPASIHAKHTVGRYPVLRPGEACPAYRQLWSWIFDGAHEDGRARVARHLLGPGAVNRIHEGRPDPVTWLAGMMARNPRSTPIVAGGPRLVVKSIHAQLSAEWLADSFDVDVLMLLRHPANVLASWLEVNLKDSRNSTLETRPEIRARYLEPWGVPLPGPDPIERISWRIGLLVAVLEDAQSRHPEWHVRSHEQLCTDPVAEFQKLYAEMGLEWGDSATEFLDEHNTPGSGFVVKRVASELSDAWQRRLDDDQLATLRRVLAWFPITTWTDRDFDRNAGPGPT